MHNIISIMGPTASGKTALAIKLAQHFSTFCVSVDSAMVYHGLDIGTAKPSVSEMRSVEHKLIDIRDPADAYSVGEFLKDTSSILSAANPVKPIIFVGGTMLYHHALQFGVAKMPESDPEVRAQLCAWAKEAGLQLLHARLCAIDPASAARIHSNDQQRIFRALEVYYQTGLPISLLQKATKANNNNFVNIILMPAARSELHSRIEQRFLQMLDLGFVDEVRALYARPDLTTALPSVRSIGYRQAWDYLAGAIDYDTFCAKAVVATRQFAKRQCTWLRKWGSAEVFDPNSSGLVRDVLTYINKQVK